nr:hypothetical protein [Tanacetum cinerariifolium]
RVACPVVSNYVRNTWGKYGLVRSMFSLSTRLFSFQFSSMNRLDAMHENGPWFIWNNPLILKKWHPNENLLKEDEMKSIHDHLLSTNNLEVLPIILNIHTLFTPGGNGINVVVPVESIRAISNRFDNTAYGFFLRKRVACPVVSNYVRNTWGKYGLVRSMFSLSTRLFSFQFSSMNRLDAMHENGPWFIWNNPLILKKWHPNENLLKEDVSTVPFWVKLHGVLVTA